jgi:hypothetical protein
MEAEMKDLYKQLQECDTPQGMVHVSEKDTNNLKSLLRSRETFRLFARDALETLGKYHPRAKTWLENEINEDVNE